MDGVLVFLLLLLFWFCFIYLFIYLFNNLAIEVTIELGELIKCPPRFNTLLPIWPYLLVEIWNKLIREEIRYISESNC